MESLLNMSSGALVKMPYDAEIEYLEGTGTQFIDTGIVVKDGLDCDYKFMPTEDVISGGYSYVFGCWGNTSNKGRYELLNYSNATGGARRSEFGYGIGSAKTGGNNVAINVLFSKDVTYLAEIRSKSLYVNGIRYATLSYSMSSNTLSCYLFTANDTQNQRPGIPQRLYFAKFYNNGELLRDCIPVRKGTVGYMYDKVSDQLFGNAGTGSFILGPDKH